MYSKAHFEASQEIVLSRDHPPGSRPARPSGETSVPVAGVLGLVVLLEITVALLAS